MNARWSEARKILAVRLDDMGDVLLTTPAIRALKQSAPGRSVTLLASRRGARVAAHVPELDAAIGYDAPWTAHQNASLGSADLAMRSLLESRRFDAAVIFTGFRQSPLPAALLCHLAGIRLRLAHCRENPHHLLTDWLPEIERANMSPVRHEVRRQLDLVAAIGAHAIDERLSFRVTAEDRLKANMRLVEAGVDIERAWIAVHPGAGAPSRRYDPRRFGEVGARLSDILRCQVVITGDADQREVCETVRERSGAHAFSLAGRLALNEFGAAIAMAPLLVSNNTAAVHIAAALGTPVVDLYALTDSRHTPWLVPHRVLCKDVPCRECFKSVCPQGHHECLRGVEVEDVVAAALQLWPAFERRYSRAA